MSRLYPALAILLAAFLVLAPPTALNASTQDGGDVLVPPNPMSLLSSVVVDTPPGPDDMPGLQRHVIEQGDTYWNIAFEAGIDVQTLLEINGLPDTSRLNVGQVLLVPTSPEAAAVVQQEPPPDPDGDAASTEDDAENTTGGADSAVVAREIDQAVVLVLDNTGSMAGAAFQAQLAATDDLVDTLSDATRLAVVTFSDDVQIAFPFSTDRSALDVALARLATGGDAALYDGVLAAVSEVATVAARSRSVLVITDGSEAGLSASDPDDAIAAARDAGIVITTVALGPNADRAYLRQLAEETGGQTFSAAAAENLAPLVSRIAGAIAAGSRLPLSLTNLTNTNIPPANTNDSAATRGLDEMTASLMSPSLVERASEGPSIPIPGGTTILNLPLSTTTLPGAGAPQGSTEAVIARIPPLENAITELDLDNTGRIQPRASLEAPVPTPLPAAAQPANAAAGAPEFVVDPERLAEDLSSNVVPIRIAVSETTSVEVAEMAINGYRLRTFEAAPFEYELDAAMLDEGDYNLTFTVVNPSGVVSAGTLAFEVLLIENGAPVPAEAGRDTEDEPGEGVNALLASRIESDSEASRVLLIDGERRAFDLHFSTEGGLTVAERDVQELVMPQQSLLDILAQPTTNLIPPAVRAALTTPRPTEAAVVILLMTVTLMPQGLFTLYWMMYSWNSPKAVEESQAPRTFIEPQKSFTALLPARHEEGVIKDTIFAVDRIDYPDELKEILVLIRDDDRGTMAKAQEAIDELGKPNVRLVTFSTGPINKPHGLNIGLGEATKEVVCVFDAEDEPHPEIYNVINTVMVEKDVDVVQSGVQLMNFRSSWFSALNVLEYFFWFKSGLHCFTRQFHVTPLGGNTVFFKRHYLEQIGGWDEQCLTEDADVGIRLTLHGAKIDIVYDAEYATQEETPATVESFIKQRTRWNQGFYQIFFKGDWARLPTLTQRITAIYILLNSLMQAAIILFLPIGIFIALTQQVAVPVALISYIPIFMLLLQLVTSLIGIREFTEAYGLKLPLGFRFKMIVAYYPYQLLLTVSAVRAVLRYITQKQSWEKTAHANLHRQGQVLGRA